MPPGAELATLSLDEDAFLWDLIKNPTDTLTVSIPDSIEPLEALEAIRSSVSMLDRVGRVENIYGCRLGRLMAIASKNPEIYKAAGYRTLQDFEQGEVIKKISHPVLWRWKLISEGLPDISLEQIARTSQVNLLDAARVSRGKSPKQMKEIMAQAEALPNKEFRETLVKDSHVGEGELEVASYLLVGTKAEVDQLKQSLGEQTFFAWTELPEPPRPIAMINTAVESTRSEWPVQGEDEMPPPSPVEEAVW